MNVIWTGSDDGLVHVTRDGGKTWTNVTPKGMPDFGRVSQIDASAFDDGTAYVAVKRPLLDDCAPYIFRTTDFGQTWTKIVNGIRPTRTCTRCARIPRGAGCCTRPRSTASTSRTTTATTWQDLSLNMPDLPIVDLVVEENELVIASHGRGFWVLDNIAPLRQATRRRDRAGRCRSSIRRSAMRSGPDVTLSLVGQERAEERRSSRSWTRRARCCARSSRTPPSRTPRPEGRVRRRYGGGGPWHAGRRRGSTRSPGTSQAEPYVTSPA